MHKLYTFIAKNVVTFSITFLLFLPFIGITQTITATRLSDGAVTTYSCDGIDDHVQINEALEYVKDQGGTVELSAHTFFIDEAIFIAGNNTTLQGVNMYDSVIKLIDDAGWVYYHQVDGEWILHRSGPLVANKKEAMRDLSFKNFKIDGNKYNQSLYNPITGETIQDTPSSHPFDGQGHYPVIDIDTRDGAIESISDILFSYVFFYENSDDSMFVRNGTNLTVNNCKGIRGGHSHVYFVDPINLLVENCDFMVTANSGIRWYDGNHIIIRNNHLYGEPEKTGNSNFCIQVTSGQSATITDDLLIENNWLEFTSGAGIALDAKTKEQAIDVIIRNNVILQCGNSGTTENMREAGGINLKNFTNTQIENNTIVNCLGGGIRLGGNVGFNTEWPYETGLTASIKDNIVTNTIQGGNSTASGYGIDIASGNNAICTFNNVWGNEQGNYFGTDADIGSLSVDPKFKSIVLGDAFHNTNDILADLHPLSEMGRWNETNSSWETDTESSMCINGGNPDDEYTNEPENNGDRINLGAYGNTNYASKGEKAPPVANAGEDQYIRDDNNDGIVYVILDGSLSTDNGTIDSFSWVRNGIEISDQEIETVPFVLGAVEVTLTVIDNDGISSLDKTFIKILPFGDNIDPIANAGIDLYATDRDNDGVETITLDASDSEDPDAIITDYIWSEDGSQIGIGVNPDIDFNVGVHTVTLTVTDNEGGTDTDTVTMEVRAKGNYALEFSNDYNDEVVITNNLSFDNTTFTIEMWVKQTATSDDAALLWLGGDGRRIMLKTSSSFPSWGETMDNTAANSISLNTWHHLAFVVTESDLTAIYIDGISQTINSPNPIDIPTGFNIGSFYGTTDAVPFNFEGIMDELRFWNTARTVTEINDNKDIELVGNELGLEAYWNFNDGSGNRLTDSVGISDGTLYNMEENDWVIDTPFPNPLNIETIQDDTISMNIYPNPVNNKGFINIDLPKEATLNVAIYNSIGQKVLILVDKKTQIGNHRIFFDASNLNSGIYVCRLSTSSLVMTKKLMISNK